ncbi:MAG TPA: hypothetical protein VMS17_28600 [Gemmataceae bacterium]|nr:hypothetical protein [Gemmataceae bacterium]
MADVPSDADRLREAGRKKILRTCLLWGVPLLALLAVAGLQYAGAIRLEEYMAEPPDKADPRVVWSALGVLALLQFLCGAIGVFQGWAGIRRAKQLQRQSAPGRSKGVSGEPDLQAETERKGVRRSE